VAEKAGDEAKGEGFDDEEDLEVDGILDSDD